MSHSLKDAYGALYQRFHRHHQLAHLSAMANWDYATMMPAGGSQARTEALAELDVLMHQAMTAPDLADLFAKVDVKDLDEWQAANLHEMKRAWQQSTVLPEDLVRAKRLAGAKCEHEWRSQRKANDWQSFAKNLKPVVELSREEAALRAQATGLSAYDALVDLYESGMTSATLDTLFAELKTWLPNLIQTITEQQAKEPYLVPQGPFAVADQERLGRAVMTTLGFDFQGGRLDVSAHPFCGGVPEDVRLTTRYAEDDFTQSLMGVIHETGHARYEQNLPRPWISQPVARARSMGIHESQSLLFEMQIGRHPAFLEYLAPLIQQHIGAQPAIAVDNLQRLYSRVQPGLIRVDADEVTYPAHVMLRYDIERALIEGRMTVDDIPDAWNEKMQAYLGLDTRGNYRDGPMQDIHWTDGAFGYFPSYTLGAMYAAQQFATLAQGIPDLEHCLATGQLSNIFAWLESSIWSQASVYDTDTLMTRATGEVLNPKYLKAHLERRYLLKA